MPDAIALRVGELVTGSRRLANVTAGLSQHADLWRANVGADELDGYVEYRPARRGAAGAAAGASTRACSRLSLPKGEAERVESLLDAQPASVPALDIVVDDFELRGKQLGRLEIEAANRDAAVARRARLAALQAQPDHARGAAAPPAPGARWRGARGAPRRAAMDFTLDARRHRRLARAPGHGPVCEAARARSPATSTWTGSPLSLDYPSLTGQLKVAIDAGQFLKADPGAARLLGVLSLQSLPRRLTLDFRDLFDEGFAFDNVTGDVLIGAGVATHQQPAHARRRGRGADGRQRRPRARDAGPARRRRARDQRRHRVARLRGHQPGDRPRHLPRAVVPAQAADRRRARASSTSPGRGTIRRSSGSSTASSARPRPLGAGRRRRAADRRRRARARSTP